MRIDDQFRAAFLTKITAPDRRRPFAEQADARIREVQEPAADITEEGTEHRDVDCIPHENASGNGDSILTP
jgi:hypothetical protein